MITESQVSVHKTFATIRSLGLEVARFEGEWKIKLPKAPATSAYFTTDNADAIATARRMKEGV